MNRSIVTIEVVELLSQLTDIKLHPQDVSSPVVFLTAILAVLNGVSFADGTLEEKEREKLDQTLYRLCGHNEQVYALTKVISQGLQEQKLYSLDNVIMLTEHSSLSEKLLLLALGYEMSVADGEMEPSEQKHLKRIANVLDIDSQHQTAIEALFVEPKDLDIDILADLRSLLDPSRFRDLDTIFVFAAEQIFEQLPQLEKSQPNGKIILEEKSSNSSQMICYSKLEKFQSSKKDIEPWLEKLSSIFKEGTQREFFTDNLTQELDKIIQLFHSQQFRVAVIGGFSQGKSTLLNVLLGEEIQPVRAIPCTGIVSYLQYGSQKKVICNYRDGRQEEIPFEQYQEKVSINKDLALSSSSSPNLNQDSSTNSIKEIILEHPNLELCKNGVVIIDSPGLDENPERTAITQSILKGIDAVIFITDATRSFSQPEIKLIQDLKMQLNGGNLEPPLSNIFIVANKWDLLRKDRDIQETKERVETIVFGQPALIAGENRVHFLSAQKSLDAILDQTDNEYLRVFQDFTDSLEKFLVEERGNLKLQQAITKMNGVIEVSLNELSDFKNLREKQITLSESEKIEILEKIGDITGRVTKMRLLADQLTEQAIEETEESWREFLGNLEHKLAQMPEQWSSEHSAVWSRDQLVNDYAYQFNRDLSNEIKLWMKDKLQKRILSKHLKELDKTIQEELNALKDSLTIYQADSQNTLTNEWLFEHNLQNAQEIGTIGHLFMTGLGVALFVPAIIFAGPILAAIGTIAGGGLYLAGLCEMSDSKSKIKSKVLEIGLEQFRNSPLALEKINEIIREAFKEKRVKAKKIFSHAVSMYETKLKLADKNLRENQEQREADLSSIENINQELQQIKTQLAQLASKLSCSVYPSP
jgi:uncharacterized tellurite resistance protein B-like protein/GTPase Era involved in 16S rRNA processing